MEMLPALLALCEGNPSMYSTHKEPVMQSFDAFFDISLKKLLQQTVKLLVMWDAMMPIWCHCIDKIIQ